ncbi:MAG: HAD family hydrolase [Erysipelotrichaceae bacterium]|nr:HAD family hydrolase [Erysipelotrichaceae bacterium]
MKNILFDLDGTLLPMDEDKFTRYYFGMLCKRMEPFGFETKKLIDTIWAGTAAMYRNDGTRSNEDAFWELFEKVYDVPKERYLGEFENFYADEFNKAVVATEPGPLARKIIDECHRKGFTVYLATNPIFPRVGTVNRIHWAGLRKEDFADITTYENSAFCKPNPMYFQEIVDRNGLDVSESIMIGNDITEDLSAKDIGMQTFLVTDCLMNKGKRADDADYRGTLGDVLTFIRGL